MCAYCRTYIPNYAHLEKPLRALTTGKGLRSCDKIERPFCYTDGRRSLHDFARAENITFINSPMAEVSHDFAWHAKCNGEKIHHCCLSVLEQVCTPRPDLLDTPLENCDNVLFVDGSASKDPQTGLNKVGFAVTTEFEVVKSGKLPSNYSAQAAELVALTEACNLMADKCVTIYTDSRYAFGVTHDFGALWKHRNFFEVGWTSDIKRSSCV